MKNFDTKFTGWAFIFAALLLWGGWAFSPHHIGEYIVASDFEKIGENVWTWIWMYRIHIFGWVTMAIALMGLISIIAKNSRRVIALPGIGMIVVGTFVLALGTAFYYNFGAWGVGQTAGKSPEEIQTFMDGILFTNQYVTCFFRFGRIFSGAGFILLGFAFLQGNVFSKWLSISTIIYGLAAMCLILFIHDNFEVYKPFFHIKVLWLIVMGVVLLTKGTKSQNTESAQ